MSWFSSLFSGQNPTLNSTIGQSGQIAGYATGAGEGATSAGLNWMKDILSGDPTKTSQALTPEISAQQGQISQAAKQGAEFGTRSGGTASANASAQAQGRGNIINLVGGLQSGTAGNLAQTGQNLLTTGLGALNQQAEMSQQRMQNWSDSILGLGVTKTAGFGVGAGLSALSAL